MAKEWAFQLYYTSRMDKICVDYLAKLVKRFTNNLMIVLDLPADLRLLVMTDIMGVAYHRRQ